MKFGQKPLNIKLANNVPQEMADIARDTLQEMVRLNLISEKSINSQKLSYPMAKSLATGRFDKLIELANTANLKANPKMSNQFTGKKYEHSQTYYAQEVLKKIQSQNINKFSQLLKLYELLKEHEFDHESKKGLNRQGKFTWQIIYYEGNFHK